MGQARCRSAPVRGDFPPELRDGGSFAESRRLDSQNFTYPAVVYVAWFELQLELVVAPLFQATGCQNLASFLWKRAVQHNVLVTRLFVAVS